MFLRNDMRQETRDAKVLLRRLPLNDVDLLPTDVLRPAGLPDDLFGCTMASLSTDECFRLWRDIEDGPMTPRCPCTSLPPLRRGPNPVVSFKPADAALAFLTANATIWQFFELSLQKRLSDLDESATAADRAHAALLELLPGGTGSMESISKKLGTSTRTLQPRTAMQGLT
jgi:hypothetical protein